MIGIKQITLRYCALSSTLRRTETVLVFSTLLFLSYGTQAESLDYKFLIAYQKQDYKVLSSYITQIQLSSIKPYLLARSANVKTIAAQKRLPADLRNLLETYRGVPGVEKLRIALLKEWASNANWYEFGRHAAYVPAWLAEGDTALGCASLAFIKASGRNPPSGMQMDILRQATSFPAVCAGAYSNAMSGAGVTTELALERLLYLLTFGPKADSRYLIDSIGRELDDLPEFHGQVQRAADLLLVARKDYLSAIRRLEQSKLYLDSRLFRLEAVHVGALGARKFERNAHALIKSVDGYQQRVAPEVAAWRNRAAILNRAWGDLVTSIEASPVNIQSEPIWQYWLSVALHNTRQEQKAVEIWTPLSAQPNYYGILAGQRLGKAQKYGKSRQVGDLSTIRTIADSPGTKRAMSLYRAGLWVDGAIEFNLLLRGADSATLYSAAQYAKKNGFIDRQISFADRALQHVDIELRYPVLYTQEITKASQNFGVPPELILGIIRQESRFIPHAISSAGALGLMQLMPTTARRMGPSAGLPTEFNDRHTFDPHNNRLLGTSYLKTLLKRYGGNVVLAIAAYNAGPSAVDAWNRKAGRLHGASFIELIPFDETREYTKHVLANYVMYCALEGKGAPITAGQGAAFSPKDCAALDAE